MYDGRLFQAAGPAKAKQRSPSLEREPDGKKWPDIQPTETGYPTANTAQSVDGVMTSTRSE